MSDSDPPPKGGRGCLMCPPCLESQCCHLIPLFIIASLLLLPSPVTLSVLSFFFCLLAHSPDFKKKKKIFRIFRQEIVFFFFCLFVFYLFLFFVVFLGFFVFCMAFFTLSMVCAACCHMALVFAVVRFIVFFIFYYFCPFLFPCLFFLCTFLKILF